jgi:hypothetical protein
MDWLIDRYAPPSAADVEEIDRNLASEGTRLRGGKRAARPLAASLHDVTIHDNRKWFGEADIRLDALVITGYGDPKDPASFYMPKTDSFPRIRDGDALPLGRGGLLMFHGPASHFVDVRIMVSRDRRGAQDLAKLISGAAGSGETGDALGTLLGLAAAAPQAAAVAAAVKAAAALGDLAFRLLQAATGETIGIYRDCHLEYRDGFGIGRHPVPDGVFRKMDLSFWYQIAREGPRAPRPPLDQAREQ